MKRREWLVTSDGSQLSIKGLIDLSISKLSLEQGEITDSSKRGQRSKKKR